MLQNKINKIQNSVEKADLLSFMVEKGFDVQDWHGKDESEMKSEVKSALHEYFGAEIASSIEETATDVVGANALQQSSDGLDMEQIKALASIGNTQTANDSSATQSNTQETTPTDTAQSTDVPKNTETPQNTDTTQNTDKSAKGTDPTKPESKAQIKRKYKADNLIHLFDTKEMEFDGVRFICDTGIDTIYSCELNGLELAKMWLAGELLFDPTMQRGVKEDSKGIAHANFNSKHVNEIVTSILRKEFTPTQIHLALVTDDTHAFYDENNDTMTVNGKVRLLDGQHRTRGMAKIVCDIKAGELKDYPTQNLEKFVFNVQMHVTDANHARVIYNDIDKNLKLDKSQKKQLQNDKYAQLVNALNLDTNSALYNKISSARPVRNKLVLFNTLDEAIRKSWDDIETNTQMNELKTYLFDFFDYLVSKNTNAFGKTEAYRIAFRESNLLNENNAFTMWIKVAKAMQGKDYKVAIDKLIANTEVFNKDNPLWLSKATVKAKQGEKDVKGFAMNNTSSGINAIAIKAFEILDINDTKLANADMSQSTTDDTDATK